MFGITGFTSVQKPRGYNYIPRSYDPDKDAWEKKKDEYRARGLDYGEKDYRPGDYIRRQKLHRQIAEEKKPAALMTLVIRAVSFCLLVAIVYLLYIFFF